MTLGLLGLTLWLRVKFGYKGYGYGILTAIGFGRPSDRRIDATDSRHIAGTRQFL